MSVLHLRPAAPADIDCIMRLETQGFHPAIRETRAVMLQRLQHFPQGFLILLNEAGEASGYLCSELWDGEASFDQAAFALGHDIRATHRVHGTRLYISSMTVDPQYRGQGLGKRFFRQALVQLQTRMPQLRDSILLLSAEWRGAHRIYLGCGYAETARLRQFFAAAAAHDADAIVMQRRLDR
ncbi:MAG TPA: GNAT family N-acetyltransferase [Oxalicibacterium sp.]|nr:GNAT family N-acetyltransferase [Oxalicibacterium sp.]